MRDETVDNIGIDDPTRIYSTRDTIMPATTVLLTTYHTLTYGKQDARGIRMLSGPRADTQF